MTKKTSIMNLSEILHLTSAIRHQINLKHYAAVSSRYLNKLKRARLCKHVILSSFSKSPEILLQAIKLILMFLLFEEHTWGLGIHTFCNVSSFRILHVTI